MRSYAACDATFQRIFTYPEIGKLCQFRNPQITGIRVWSVKDFSSYLVFYRFSENQIEILRILHGARDLETLFETEFGAE